MMMLVDSATVRSLRQALGEARVRAVERELQAALVLLPPAPFIACAVVPRWSFSKQFCEYAVLY